MDAAERAYLDAKFDPIAEDIAEIKSDVKDVRKDVGALQRWRSYVHGVVAVSLLVAGGAGTTWIALLR